MMKGKLSLAALLSILLLITDCSVQNVSKTPTSEKKVKNIILFIGDGMGTAHVYAAMTTAEKPLILESFPY